MISIIVPVYKVETYLPKCIESLINQTYSDLQIILVDDGSPDGCGGICDAYAAKDGRITVIHQKNAGVSAARNAGLAIAQGEYIGFVDPDDWVKPEMYAMMVAAMETQDAELAVCGYDYVEEDGSISCPYQVREKEVLSQEQLIFKLFDMPPTVRHGVVNKLFRQSVWQDLRFPEELHSSEDVFVLTEYVQRVHKAVFVHQPLYQNLVRMGSATHGGLKIESLASSFVAHDYMHRVAVAQCPGVKNHSLAFLMDVCLLKYIEAERRLQTLAKPEQTVYRAVMGQMRRYIRRHAWQALFDREIYWKTRIMYLLV